LALPVSIRLLPVEGSQKSGTEELRRVEALLHHLMAEVRGVPYEVERRLVAGGRVEGGAPLEELASALQELSSRTKTFEDTLKDTSDLASETSDEFIEVRERVASLVAAEAYRAWAEHLGQGLDYVPLARGMPIRLYLDDPDDEHALRTLRAVADALKDVLDGINFEVAAEDPVETGSLFKTWWGRSRDPATAEAFRERLEKLERAAELQALDKPQAQVDFVEAQAVRVLVDALPDDIPSAVQIGSLLVLSIPGQGLIARTLSRTELVHLERNQEVLRDPATTIDRLADLCRSEPLPHSSLEPPA
jgi:hypothetical protein